MTAAAQQGGAQQGGARRIWLVRHGETTGQSSIRYHGRNDVPLSEHGKAQIRALAPWLAGVSFASVVHSPLQRAAESAAILGEHLRLPGERFTADERLREISFGACEGLTREEIDAAFPDFWRAYRAGETDCFPDGEPRAAFAARVAAAFAELAAAPWQGDLLVVAHRGIVRQGLCALLGVPGHGPDPFGVELGSLSVVRHEGAPPPVGGWQLELLGARP
ncbi:MAG: histidine phosphatase family protein [Planctomycetes bacterium]|nr:histidine phosphatase family protein [Planctomycetota bacterium]